MQYEKRYLYNYKKIERQLMYKRINADDQSIHNSLNVQTGQYKDNNQGIRNYYIRSYMQMQSKI